MRSRAAVLLAALLVAVPGARASVWIADDAVRPQLAVDATGAAEVTWTHGGVKQTVVVPRAGQLTHGGVLLQPSWLGRRYRATVAGPNVGAAYAPDAQAVIAARA